MPLSLAAALVLTGSRTGVLTAAGRCFWQSPQHIGSGFRKGGTWELAVSGNRAIYQPGFAREMPKASPNAKARAEGPRRAVKGGDVTGDRPKGEGLGLGGARDVWLREPKPP